MEQGRLGSRVLRMVTTMCGIIHLDLNVLLDAKKEDEFKDWRDTILSELESYALSPTGSALARTDLSPLTNGNWVIHAAYSCFLHPPFLAKIGYIP